MRGKWIKSFTAFIFAIGLLSVANAQSFKPVFFCLKDIRDVSKTPPTDGQGLVYVASTGLWTPGSIGGAPTDAHYLTDQAEAGLSAEVVVSANGKAIATAADYAAMKALLDLEIGTDVQAQNAVLTELTALTDPGADKYVFWNNTSNDFEFSAVIAPIVGGLSVGASGSAGLLEFEDATGDVFSLQVGVQSGNTAYTLPIAFPGVSGYVLSSTDAGVMSWVANGAGGGDNITVNTVAATNADFDDATPAAQAGGVNVAWQKDASAPDNISAYLAWGANLKDAIRKKPFFFTDMLGQGTVDSFPFGASSVSSGTLAGPAIAVTAAHPGVVRLQSSTTTNSGYRVQTGSNQGILIAGGEVYECVFTILYQNITDITTARIGFHDSSTSADATDGAYIEMIDNGANLPIFRGKTASNSTRTTTGTSYTGALATWYRVYIAVNSDATSVAFYIYDDAGTQLWTDANTTNIPTASGRDCWAGMSVTNVGTTARDLMHLDYMSFGYGVAKAR